MQPYDWQGKTGTTLDDEHVFAFNCYGSYTCTILSDSDTYTFAVSGDNTLGGDSFTTNASNEGPGDTAAWNTSIRFGTTAKQYWSGYRTGSSSYWTETNGGGDTDPTAVAQQMIEYNLYRKPVFMETPVRPVQRGGIAAPRRVIRPCTLFVWFCRIKKTVYSFSHNGSFNSDKKAWRAASSSGFALWARGVR